MRSKIDWGWKLVWMAPLVLLIRVPLVGPFIALSWFMDKYEDFLDFLHPYLPGIPTKLVNQQTWIHIPKQKE